MKTPRALSLALLVLMATSLVAAPLRLGEDVVPTAQTIKLTADPRKDDYSGSVVVDLQVKKPTKSFRFHAEDLTITSLKLTKGKSAVKVTHAPSDEATVLVTAKRTLKPGTYSLSVDFTNKYNVQAVGLYKMMAKAEPYLFTQFEAIDARRAFPTWDEPSFKFPFEMTVTIPSQYDAVSNTPVASEFKSGALKTIRFARTKPLPSYLIALAVGAFEYTPIEGMSVPGRVVVPKGQNHLAKLAAEITPPVLAALEKYFGGRHPFEKIDLIAVPEYWAGAMENPGAITYRDTILLLDPARATPSQRRDLIRVTAHELAHMWFGDVVTMEWWDDLWLNESFADWMGDKITQQLHPELGTETAELHAIQAVMDTDARATTDPIRRRDQTPGEAMRAVGLAYNKGKAVLSMFEKWIGAERFREGVLAHIKANEWGNANAGELFASVAKHAPEGTAAAFETFITQPGIPLVTVEMIGPNEMRLTQSRFSTGTDVQPQTWRVPVTMHYSDGTTTRTAAVLLDSPSKTVKLDGERVAWIFPHADAAGYYRWKMPADSMSSLAARASDVLSANERLAFVGNAGALFRSGVIHGDAYLELLNRFANDADPTVIQKIMSSLFDLRATFDSAENRPRFAAYVRSTLGPTLDRMGMTPKPGEPITVTILRPSLLNVLGSTGNDERVIRFANEQLPKFLADPSSVDSTIASTVISIAVRNGDAALFEELRKRFESATTPIDRQRYLSALGSFRDPAIIAKAREYALTPAVRANEFFRLWGSSETAEERDDAFAWATSNFDAIAKRLPPDFVSGMPMIASGCEPERVERARQFFASRNSEATARTLARVSESVNDCAKLRAREMAVVTEYLASAH